MYKILEAYNTRELTDIVNKYMQDGWLPQGGICFSDHNSIVDVYTQAIIRININEIAIDPNLVIETKPVIVREDKS